MTTPPADGACSPTRTTPSLLSWLLNQAYLTDRPCAMEEVYAAYEAELAAQRRAAAPTQRAAVAARAAGRAALHGEAHQQVRDIFAQRARAAAAG